VHYTADLRKVFLQEDTPHSKTKPQQIRPRHPPTITQQLQQQKDAAPHNRYRMRHSTVATGRGSLQHTKGRQPSKESQQQKRTATGVHHRNRPHHTTDLNSSKQGLRLHHTTDLNSSKQGLRPHHTTDINSSKQGLRPQAQGTSTLSQIE
jgi:hypothetical protein